MWITEEQNSFVLRGLLGVCHQIREEALGIYYRGNTFGYEYLAQRPHLVPNTSMVSWLRSIGRRNRALLREIYIWVSNELADKEKLAPLEAEKGWVLRAVVFLSLDVSKIRSEEHHLSLQDLEAISGKEARCVNDPIFLDPTDSSWAYKDPSVRAWKRALTGCSDAVKSEAACRG